MLTCYQRASKIETTSPNADPESLRLKFVTLPWSPFIICFRRSFNLQQIAPTAVGLITKFFFSRLQQQSGLCCGECGLRQNGKMERMAFARWEKIWHIWLILYVHDIVKTWLIKASPRGWMPNTHFKQEENSCLTPQPFVRGRCGLVGASNSFGYQLWVRVTLWLKASWFGVVLILAFEAKDQSFLHSFLFSWSKGRRGIGKQKHNSTG